MQAGYVLLIKWLPTDVPCTLPRYGFTQIGVGGVVLNKKGEVAGEGRSARGM